MTSIWNHGFIHSQGNSGCPPSCFVIIWWYEAKLTHTPLQHCLRTWTSTGCKGIPVPTQCIDPYLVSRCLMIGLTGVNIYGNVLNFELMLPHPPHKAQSCKWCFPDKFHTLTKPLLFQESKGILAAATCIPNQFLQVNSHPHIQDMACGNVCTFNNSEIKIVWWYFIVRNGSPNNIYY